MIQEQLTRLSATVEHFPHLNRAQELPNAHAVPPHPALLPQPHFLPEKSYSAAIATETPAVVYNKVQLESIKDIVNNAKHIVGFAPISTFDIASAQGEDQNQKIRNATVNFLRNKLGVTDEEIKDDDILATFPADDPNMQRIYMQFPTHAHADFCLELIRTLKKPELRVVKFIPKQFTARNRAIENEAFILRKHTIPPYKTRIEFSDTDLVLTKCLHNKYTYGEHIARDLPPIVLGPRRPPPPGKKKRSRSQENSSPNPADFKNDRVDSPNNVLADIPVSDVAGEKDNLGEVGGQKLHLN